MSDVECWQARTNEWTGDVATGQFPAVIKLQRPAILLVHRPVPWLPQKRPSAFR